MKAVSEWERFFHSGKVTDYLAFKEKETREEEAERTGKGLYAGFRDSDRHGDLGVACGGI